MWQHDIVTFFVVSVKNQTFDLEVSGIITTFAF